MAGRTANGVRFTPTAGSTTDWTYSAAVTGFNSPALGGMVDGGTYSYRAESADLSQWELGKGVYTSGTGVLTRVTVLQNSSGTGTLTGQSGAGTKINFTLAPTVTIVPTREDLLAMAEAITFTTNEKAQGRSNLDILKRNYIRNGAMMVSQRNGTTAGTTSGYFPADLFSVVFSNAGAISTAQVASATAGGSPNRLRVTVTTADAAVASTDFLEVIYALEGPDAADLKLGAASAKAITIQFGVKAPAGTYCVVAINSAVNRSYVAEYVIAGGEANTDVIKSVSFTLDTSGTWLTAQGTIGLLLRFGLMAGSSFQQAAGSWSTGNPVGSASQFNLMGTLSNVFELYDVGLYDGNVAPAFEVDDFQSTLTYCQRFWEKSYDYSVAVGAVSSVGDEAFFMQMSSATMTGFGFGIRFKVEKCKTPTVVAYSPVTGTSGKFRDFGTASADVNATLDHVGTKGCRAFNNTLTAATVVALSCHWTSDASLI